MMNPIKKFIHRYFSIGDPNDYNKKEKPKLPKNHCCWKPDLVTATEMCPCEVFRDYANKNDIEILDESSEPPDHDRYFSSRRILDVCERNSAFQISTGGNIVTISFFTGYYHFDNYGGRTTSTYTDENFVKSACLNCNTCSGWTIAGRKIGDLDKYFGNLINKAVEERELELIEIDRVHEERMESDRVRKERLKMAKEICDIKS